MHIAYNEHILPDDYQTDVLIPRATQDVATNANGYLLIDVLKQTCLKIANGRVFSDKHVGSYTFVGVNGSSLVDYCITDPSLFEYFKTFVAHDPCILSEHCLMEKKLSSKNIADILHNEDNSQLLTENMYKWKDEHNTIYVENISSQHSLQYMESLCDDLELVTSVLKQSFTNDSTGENKRKEYYKLLNIYRHNNTVENKIQLINARKHYKDSVWHFNF